MAAQGRLGLKQITGLVDVPRSEMLEEIASGLPLVQESATELAAAAAALPPGHERAGAILSLHAEEESAKALMLLDLVRCPIRHSASRRRLARQVYDHLARLIYAESCGWRPVSFAELRQYVEREREQFYLDGPNDVDYVYLNDLIHQREGLLYTDHVRWEHGYEWHRAGPPWGGSATIFPYALQMVSALAAVGMFAFEALAVVDSVWDPLEMTDATQWHEIAALNRATLDRLDASGLLRENDDAVRHVLEWPMPLYPLDLRMHSTDIEVLRQIRARYDPS
jgi:hypothetical protein